MLIHAAAHSDSFQAVVSEGASAQSVRDELANPGTSVLELVPLTSLGIALTAFTSELPPAPLHDEVARNDAPVFFIYGEHAQEGAETKPNQGFYAAAGEPKQIWEVPDGQHVAGITTEPEEYERRVIAFLDGALLRKEPR